MTDHSSMHREPEFQGEEIEAAGHRGRSHSWMMIICCIPMLVIAVALVATGIVGPGFIVAALACTAMMALMMRGMHQGHP